MSIEAALGSNCKVCGITSRDIDSLWPQVRPHIERVVAESRGECTVDDIRDFLHDRVMQLWIAYDANKAIKACMVTQIIHYPRRKLLRIVILSGEGMKDWQYGWEFVETWARHQGCDGMETFARFGFVRQCKELGFKAYYTIIGKDFLPLDVH